MTIQELREKIAALSLSMDSLTGDALAAALNEGNALRANLRDAELAEERASFQAALSAPKERKVQPAVGAGPVAVATPRASLARTITAARNATRGIIDPAVFAANEMRTDNGPDGGFLIQPALASEIWDATAGKGSGFLEMLTFRPQSVASLRIPTYETMDSDEANGVTVARVGEGEAAPNPSKPGINYVDLRLEKLVSRVNVTDELQRDIPFMSSFASSIMARKMRAKLEKWVLQGSGVGEPLGLLKGPGTVAIAKEADQTGASVALRPANLHKMIAALVDGGFARSFWVVNSALLPEIWGLSDGKDGAYQKDFSVSPYGTLMGRPVFTSDQAAGVHVKGDVALIDPAGAAYGQSVDGVTESTNIWLYWESGITALKTQTYVSGAPLLKTPGGLTDAQGNRKGHVIVLADRA